MAPKYTPKQLQAIKLATKYDRILLYGGSRSGKTFLICLLILARAVTHPRSRHLIVRLRFNHAKVSIWLDTLRMALLAIGLVAPAVVFHESDHYITLWNGSEVWVDGLDDKDRVEKILGREYNTIFFNEVSQIPYGSVTTALTRLSLQIPGCRNAAYFDCNPTGRGHWAYRLFIKKQDPETKLPVKKPERLAHLRINPVDNRGNLAEGYIEDTLESLPEAKRKRFLRGEWTDPEDVIFTNWKIIDEIPEIVRQRARRSYGLDFGYSVDPAAFVQLYLTGKLLYLEELIYETGLLNAQLFTRIMEVIQPGDTIWADSSEPKTIEEFYQKGLDIHPAYKGPDSINAGIDWLQSHTILVPRTSTSIIEELENYCWKRDKNDNILTVPIDDFNHAIDGSRYGANAWTNAVATAESLL